MPEFSNLENREEIATQNATARTWSDPDDRPLDVVNPEHTPYREVNSVNTGRTVSIDSRDALQNSAATREALLFSDNDVASWRSQWSDVQAGFVDEPRRSVEQAEELVSTVLQKLAESFTSERDSLEKHWTNGETVSTEDLRVALQRYRAFFGKLLNAA
jgi:hypothetical protein